MKLGLAIGYSGANLRLPIERINTAEKLGYDSVWSAEAYGSDAISPLAFIAAQTKRIRLGSGMMQLAARTPANAAMCAATVDALAGGNRFIAGLGLPGEFPHYRPWLEEGFRRRGGVRSLENFEIYSQLPVVIERDERMALARMKPEVDESTGLPRRGRAHSRAVSRRSKGKRRSRPSR